MIDRKHVFAIAASLIAAGCSGGGSNPTSSPVAPPASSAPTSFGKSNASISVVIHSRTSAKRRSGIVRKRDYVSPATQGLVATFVDNANTSTSQGFTLSPGAQPSTASPAGCGATASDGSFTCTLFFDLTPAGSPYAATLTAYDSAQSGTSATPASNSANPTIALSTATQTVSIAANASNTFAFTLNGIVEGFNSSPQYLGANAVPNPSATPFSTIFHALDGDNYSIDEVDGSTAFAFGNQSGGPFAPASFAVSANDENGCATAPCTSLAPSAPGAISDPTMETVGFSYNGGGAPGDGTTVMPYYGLVGLTGPSGYTGYTSATVENTAYAAAEYVVPFFAIVDPANTTTRTDATDVAFTSSSDTANLYALQYHLPTGSMGYTIDTSACGSIASATGPTPLGPGFGASFALSAGTASGTCSVTLGDGAGDTAVINVTSTAGGGAVTTVPCAPPTLAPNTRNRKTTAAASCPQHTATLYATYGGNPTIDCTTPSGAVASLQYAVRGTVTTTDLPNGMAQATFVYTGGDPNATYTANLTCVASLGTFTTDATGSATATFSIPAGFNAPAGSMHGFDASDGTANSNNPTAAITGVFTL